MDIDELQEEGAPAYSVCTLVTDHDQYARMKRSMVEAGFGEEDCEYLYIDNSESNRHDAYSGIRRFLDLARGSYVILCHQDVLLLGGTFNPGDHSTGPDPDETERIVGEHVRLFSRFG